MNIPSLLVAVYAYPCVQMADNPADPYGFFENELNRKLKQSIKYEEPPKAIAFMQGILDGRIDFVKGLAKFFYRVAQIRDGKTLTQVDLNRIFALMAIAPFIEPNSKYGKNYGSSLAGELALKLTEESGIAPTPFEFSQKNTSLSPRVLWDDLVSSAPPELKGPPEDLLFFTKASDNAEINEKRLEDLRQLLMTYVRIFYVQRNNPTAFQNVTRLSEQVALHVNAYQRKRAIIQDLMRDRRRMLIRLPNNEESAQTIKELGRKIRWELTELKEYLIPPVLSAMRNYKRIMGALPHTLRELDLKVYHSVSTIDRIIKALNNGEADIGVLGSNIRSSFLGQTPPNPEDAMIEEFGETDLSEETLKELARVLEEMRKGGDVTVFDSGHIDENMMQEIENEVQIPKSASATQKALLGLTSFAIVAGAIIWYRKSKTQKSLTV